MLRACEDGDDGPGSCIKAGDQVVAYLGRDNLQSIIVVDQPYLECKYGGFPTKEWVGKPFGSKVFMKHGEGYVYLLAPTPELWTRALIHRTQVLYAADISLITCYMELKPGQLVLESGTGSGSLTHALARTVAPNGRVNTFEFHSQRALEAHREFVQHGIAETVDVEVRDVEADGFPDRFHGKADGVFLDLPGPWKVVPSAGRCLRGDGVFCAFSPCIEQVQKTCAALSRADFWNLRTFECLLRYQDVREVSSLESPACNAPGLKRKRHDDAAKNGTDTSKRITVKPHQEARGHTGYLTFARRVLPESVLETRSSPGPAEV